MNRFFKPKFLKAFGYLQDGGMRANNPTEAGLWELGKIWPRCAQPTMVLSIGTGSRSASAGHSGLAPRGIIQDGFVARAYRAFMSSPSLDGQSSWLALLNGVDESVSGNYHRLNLTFDGPEPELDDIGQMMDLPRQVQSQFTLPPELKMKLWASRFFFEIEDEPKYFLGYYVCRGNILCLFRDARALLRHVHNACGDVSFVLNQGKRLAPLDNISCCPTCGFYRQAVKFDTPQLHTHIEMALTASSQQSCHISGFPNSMQWFVDRQVDPATSTVRTATPCKCGQFKGRKRPFATTV